MLERSGDSPAFEVLSPLGRSRRTNFPAAARLASLAGKTIGLLDNSKRNANLILDEIGRSLLEQGATRVIYKRKASAAMAGGALLDELAEHCDAVVNAHGDCGSCTSWCIHDSVTLERLGVPVATINTSEFASLGRLEAIALGMPYLPIVTIAHPVSSLSDPVARERGRAASGAVIEALKGRPGEIAVQGAGPAILGDEAASDCGCAA